LCCSLTAGQNGNNIQVRLAGNTTKAQDMSVKQNLLTAASVAVIVIEFLSA